MNEEFNVDVYNTWITPDDVLKKPYNGMAYRKALDLENWKNDFEIYHPVDLESIEIVNGDSATIKVGRILRLIVKAVPSTAVLPGISFVSSDKSVAIVNSEGIILGVSEGEATISAYNGETGSKISDVTITVSNGSEPGPGPEPHDYSKDYLTIERAPETTECRIFLGNIDDDTELYYSIDSGETWEEFTKSKYITLENIGDTMLLKGNNSDTTLYGLQIGAEHTRVIVKGNIMSLLYGDDFEDKTVVTKDFAGLFENNGSIVDASNLILPATTLIENCYYRMFYGCTNLTTAPELPAETLAVSCYGQMFYSCRSLTIAPELPAQTLAEACYSNMFYGCALLNYIKCLATDISASGCINDWLRDVAESGTFVCDPTMVSTWEEQQQRSYLPTGWTITVEDAE